MLTVLIVGVFTNIHISSTQLGYYVVASNLEMSIPLEAFLLLCRVMPTFFSCEIINYTYNTAVG